MVDWLSSMQQTYEFYVVDPYTWKDSTQLNTITKCNINRDSGLLTLGSATIDSTEALDECYVRVYLVVVQNGSKTKVPLGTFLVQTPSVSFNGKLSTISMDAYTPLIELKGSMPPIGYAVLKNENIMEAAYVLCRENMRAPIVKASSEKVLENDFVSNLDDTWMSFLSDLVYNAKFTFGLDELGRVIFEPIQDTASLRPVWTYDDGNSSILYPDIEDERDLYGVPNVVEVVYSSNVGYKFSRVVNNDPNSPSSTVRRGREVVYRETRDRKSVV